MASPSRKSCGGFTYLAALFMIMIMGIMLGAIGQSWSVLMKREREEELFFRGSQIKDAITRYYTAPKNGSGAPRHPSMGLRELKELLKDPKELTTTRWLRQLYTDPVTGEEWKVITGPVKGKGAMTGIIGVASTSDEKPLKQAGFPDDYKTFEGKTKYSEWQFVYGQPQPVLTHTPADLPTDPTWNRRNES